MVFSLLRGPAGYTLGAPNTAGGGVLPLLYEANVTGAGRYLGAFKVPSDGGQANPNNWSGSNTGESGAYVAYNSVSGTLFITSRNVGGSANIAEITIPSGLDVTGVPANMPTASWAGSSLSAPRFFDITNGNRSQSITTPNTGYVANGIFTDGANVYQNFEGSYDSTGETLAPLWKRAGLTLSSGTVTGPISFSTSKTQRTLSGAMCAVPAAYVSALGGDILQADKQWSINGTQNEGPFLASYNSSQIGSVSPLPTTVLCDYQFPLSTQPQWTKSQSTTTQGLAFPTGTRSVLQIGVAGKGTAQYGDPLIPADGIYDPANSDKGWHAYPYKWHIWAYDANDLAAVKAGTKASNTVLCYADWDVTMPPNVGESSRIVSGSCFDDVNKRLFITECGYSRAGSLQPIIHVFQLVY